MANEIHKDLLKLVEESKTDYFDSQNTLLVLLEVALMLKNLERCISKEHLLLVRVL